MNPQDLIALAKEIYAIDVALHPGNWDKQKMAREAIESATQFFLALQSEREGGAYSTGELQPHHPPGANPKASTEQSQTVYSTLTALEQHRTTSNQQAAGRGRLWQEHHPMG